MRLSVRIEELSPVKKRLDVEVSPEDVKREIESAYNRLKSQAKIKGFRKGKVPRSIIERLYKDQVEGEVASKLVTESLSQAMKDKDVTPISTPEVEPKFLDAGKGFSYSATFEVQPEVRVSGYEGMEIEREEVVISEEEISNSLEALRENHAYVKDCKVDRAVRDGDLVTLDLEGFIEGVPLRGGNIREYTATIGSKDLFPSLEKGIIGMKKGEEREIDVEFPVDYRDEKIAGKKVLFKVTLKGIKEKIYPDINDEFARDLNSKNLIELKEKIKKDLQEQKEKEEERRVREKVLKELIDNNPFELPLALLENHTRHLLDQTINGLSKQGKTLKDIDMSLEELRSMCRERAEREIRSNFILNAIANKESISITDNDVEEYIKSRAVKLGETYENLRRFYNERNLIGLLRMELLEDRVFDLIKGRAKNTLSSETKSKGED